MARRVNIDVPGVSHGDMPIPMATKVGNMVFSSGIHAMDPDTGTIPDDPRRQVELVFQHMRTIVENAGGTTDDIGLQYQGQRPPFTRQRRVAQDVPR